MQSQMPPQAYVSEDWFQLERERLFGRLWQFIGLKTMLKRPNAFITRTLHGLPIVVQNMDGELQAFENLCAHRQNPLQSEPNGVRPLVCSYHGWGYDSHGAAVNIPFHDQVFRLEPKAREALRLRRFALREVGNLVFINLSSEPVPFDVQFDEATIASLQACSEAFDDEVLQTTFQMRCNWKLVYENLRDSHHPRYLHSQSLYKDVKFAVHLDENALRDARRLHSRGVADRAEAMSLLRGFSNGGPNEPMQAAPRYPWHEYVERFGELDWYYNWLVYPNLHIASGTGGYSFIIEHHVPVSAGRTDLTVYFMTARKKRRYKASAAVLHAHITAAQRVLREDIDVMERIQQHLHLRAPQAVLGDYEHANLAIERWYLDVMNGRVDL